MSQFLATFILFVLPIITKSDYYYVNKILPWSDARQYCQAECNSDLVSIHSNTQFNEIISNSIPEKINSNWVWIGLKNNEWTDQISPNYYNWQSSQPESITDCVVMTAHKSYQWETEICSKGNTFICNSCHHNIADISPSYHINPNILTWKNATSYCKNHCNSNLASIHNERDNVYAKYLATNGLKLHTSGYSPNVSIGLFKLQSASEWEWSDGSIFDYGNNYKPGEFLVRPYPWTDKLLTDNTDEKCVRMRSDENYEFQESNCSDSAISRFMCDSCDSKLNKYIVVNTKMEYSQANVYCKTEFGMSLASIHSMSDYNEAKYLCELNNNGDCYIGLTWTSSTYEYDDNTQFDFGNDLNMYPWSTQITHINGDQVLLCEEDEYKWKPVHATLETHTFICNMPSQFCNGNDWSVFGDYGWTFDATNNCNVKYSNNGAIIMTNKQFMNTNGELLIELIYSATNILNSDSSAGIMLFNMQSDCDYYYISITPGINSKLALGKVNNGIYDILTMNNTITFQLGVSYVLRATVINTNTFKIYVNNNLMIEYTDISNTNSNILSGYIGIMNRNLDSIFRSLHISGSEWIYDNINLNTCNIPQYNTKSPTKEPTISPANIPTHIPSIYPSINPSFQPTEFPSFDPTKFPSFEPTYIPTTEPTYQPTYKPINYESGSVDDHISTTIMSTKQHDTQNINKHNHLFLYIIYILVGIVICFLMGVCILIIYVKKNKLNVEMNKENVEKRLELEGTKPEPIKIKITKRQLTTEDSMEQMYGENEYNDEIITITAGETPITATATSTGNTDENQDILNESDSDSDSDSDIENDYINQMYKKPTIGKITQGFSQGYSNVNSRNDNKMILNNDYSESDDNMYINNTFVKETKTSGEM
eukprot:450470_1